VFPEEKTYQYIQFCSRNS